MKRLLVVFFPSGTIGTSASAPSIIDDSVSMRNAGGVSYVLPGEPSIVTVDTRTNAGNGVWASIGGLRRRSMSGSVNRSVPGTGVPHTVARKPYKDREGRAPLSADEVRAEVAARATDAPPDYRAVSLIDRKTCRAEGGMIRTRFARKVDGSDAAAESKTTRKR